MLVLFTAIPSNLTFAAGLPTASDTGILADGLRVRLNVRERAGVERLGEPISAGVPFPANVLFENDVPKLGLVDANGQRVPAQFKVTNRWWNHPNKPARWVLVDFAASAPAGGTVEYFLATNMPHMPSDKAVRLNIESNAATKAIDRIAITTGPLKFVVKRSNFNVIDEAWLDESGKQQFDDSHRMVAPHQRGAVIFSALNGGQSNKHYLASNSDKGTLEVEEDGPLRATIKLTGVHISRDGISGPEQMLDYICRISAFAGSPLVRVSYVFACRQGTAIDQALPMDGMYIELPLTLKGAKYAIGKSKGVARGDLPAGARAYCLADTSDHFEFGGAAKALGNGHTKNCLPLPYRWASDKSGAVGLPQADEKPQEYGDAPDGLGWVDLSDGQRGVATGIRWFWQLWPKAVEARNTPDGSSLRLHLWANVDEKVLSVPGGWSPSHDSIVSRQVKGRANVFPGMSKTHDFYFLFHGTADDKSLEGVWHGHNRPLRALCDPEWYCEKARGWDMIPSSTPGIYKPDDFKIVQDYDKRIKDWNIFIRRFRGKEYNGFDSYGTFHFGNCINFVKNRPNNSPLDILWDNHYYDFPHAVFLQFARTGDLDLFETGVEADVNLADVAMCCWNPDPELIGCSRYSPSADMIRRDGEPHDVFTPEVYSWHRVNFDRWWLLGDRHAFDMNYLFADFVRRHSKVLNLANMNVGHGMRSRGHMLANLSKGYIATGEMPFLSAAKAIYYGPVGDRGKDWKPDYQYGIWLEGTYQFHLASGDRRPMRSLTTNVKEEINGLNIFTFGIAAMRSDAPEILKMVREKYSGTPGVKMMWGAVQDFGLQLRSAPYGLWALTDPEKLAHMENPPDILRSIPIEPGTNVVAKVVEAPEPTGENWLKSADAVPTLIGMLESPTEDVRAMSANLLAEQGVKAAAALPKLKERLAKEESKTVKKAIEDAIAKIGGSK